MKRKVTNNGRLSLPGDIAKLFGGKLNPLYVCREYGSDSIYLAIRTPEYTTVEGKNCTDIIIGVPYVGKENTISLPTCTYNFFGLSKTSTDILLEAQKFISTAGDEYFKVYLRATK